MKNGIMYNQREIILVPFPYSDLTSSKQRPALIISNSLVNKSEDRICCLITSNPLNKGVEIKKEDFEKGKLPFKSWIKVNRIFSVNEKIIKKKLCIINKSFHKQIIGELNRIFELEN